MIIIIVACVLAVGFIMCMIGSGLYMCNLKELGGAVAILSAVALLPLLIAFGVSNSGTHISTELYLQAWKAQRIIKSYEDAIETDDKRMIVARQAEIAVYNEEVEAYKRHSKNPLIGCFYPKKVADNLEYIEANHD